MKIFNRWGAVLFETSDISPNDLNAGWNGEFNGEVLDAGIYVYFVEVLWVDGMKEILKGDVLLIK
ncbi:MAG: hypothetical protein ACI9XO_002239 [Paraglaciecola sp.]|jgi:hypothetical protein